MLVMSGQWHLMMTLTTTWRLSAMVKMMRYKAWMYIYYEAMVQAIKNKYPNCSIISILESSQRDYTANITTIQSICEHYSIPVADTIAAFNNSGKAYDDLESAGVHPNDAGQEIYYETVKNVIDKNVAVSTGKMKDADALMQMYISLTTSSGMMRILILSV